MFVFLRLPLLLAVATLVGCAATPGTAELDALTRTIAQSSFRDRGVAKLDRLQQDEANRLCSAADVAGAPLDDASAKALEAASLKTIRAPSDGRYLGDWKSGERIAQNGRGLTWTDKEGDVNGGNCYNCHQISQQELSYGTLGPSLYQYGKLRGVTDPASPEARAMVEYTWGKLWNARAFNACSNMPRFGHNGILNEAQIKDIMALLLDPKSPVNQ
ncbi:MAG: sulfur oxidation c-type cytochrome SoxX [Rhodoferax sp.]|nr:sulfur oxidation c-type cytochrome SoxX [Rhodoferax sp.]